MAVCPQCRKPVADEDEACPGCGASLLAPQEERPVARRPPSDSSSYAIYIGIGVFLLIAVLGISALMSGSGPCQDCKGRGKVYCTVCRGGKLKCSACNGQGQDQQTFSTCAACKGVGTLSTTCTSCNGTQQRPCPACRGTGRKPGALR
jgi:hypothetical protein